MLNSFAISLYTSRSTIIAILVSPFGYIQFSKVKLFLGQLTYIHFEGISCFFFLKMMHFSTGWRMVCLTSDRLHHPIYRYQEQQMICSEALHFFKSMQACFEILCENANLLPIKKDFFISALDSRRFFKNSFQTKLWKSWGKNFSKLPRVLAQTLTKGLLLYFDQKESRLYKDELFICQMGWLSASFHDGKMCCRPQDWKQEQ